MTSGAGRRLFAAASLAALMAAAGSANAAEPYENEAPRPDPIYLRFNFGFGRSTISSSADGRTIRTSGPIVTGAFGTRVSHSFAIFVESFNQLIWEHEDVGVGQDQGFGRFDTFGAGVVWTLPVIEVYVGQTVSAAWLKIPSEKGWTVDTGGHFITQTMIGKDWQVSPRWWVGMAGHAVYGGSWYYAPRLFGLSATLAYN